MKAIKRKFFIRRKEFSRFSWLKIIQVKSLHKPHRIFNENQKNINGVYCKKLLNPQRHGMMLQWVLDFKIREIF